MRRPQELLPIVIGLFTLLAGIGWFFVGLLCPDVPSFLLFAMFIGLYWIILGIGSMMLKRWACKLLLTSGWLLIALGLGIVLLVILKSPSIFKEMSYLMGPGNKFAIIIRVVVYALIPLLFVAAPGALFVVVYKSKIVQFSSQHLDLEPCWIDRIPIPVLVLCNFFFVCALFALPAISAFKELGDYPSYFVFVGLALIPIFSILVYGFSFVSKWSWWAALIYFILLAGVCFYMFQDVFSVEGDGVNEVTRVPVVLGAAFSMATIAYLFWIRKYFYPQS